MSDIIWTTAGGKKIPISEMDENHAKNCLRMVIKENERLVRKYNLRVSAYNKLVRAQSRGRYGLNGDMANFFNESQANEENAHLL